MSTTPPDRDHVCMMVDTLLPVVVADGIEYSKVPALVCRHCGYLAVTPIALRQMDAARERALEQEASATREA